MKPEDLFDRIGDADDAYVADARHKKKKRPWIPVSAVAAALALVILIGAFLQPWNGGSPFSETTGRYTQNRVDPNLRYDAVLLAPFTLMARGYPTMVQYPSEDSLVENYEKWSKDYDVWRQERRAQKEAFRSLESLPTAFFESLVRTMLGDSEGENVLCSPVNIYMALAMLAETVEGESRREILDVLGEESIESLRITAGAIWNAHYCDDGAVTSILASSVWLDKDISYVTETVERIAELYYASSFQGEMGSEEYNEALRAWINTQTGGILSEGLESLEMYPETVFALATTVYYTARWQHVFEEAENDQRVFHGASGDVLSDYMNRVSFGQYYWGEEYSAVSLPFAEGGSMYFVLPDEGKTVDDVLMGSDLYELLERQSLSEKSQYCKITMHIPKFDVSSQKELSSVIREMGVTSVFSSHGADFSHLFGEGSGGVALSEVQHGVRVAIDEEGVVAAAYTVMLAAGSAAPQDEVEFTVDRPFLFVITSEVGLPLFVGVVNNLK